jgi:choloylglycine hydrolase
MPPEKPVRWISKYGSITFNQVGKEFPFGGINEKGLVVEMLGLEDTQYPEPDERPAITEYQYPQFLLDNFSTVNEVIENTKKIRISQMITGVHYLVCDSFGNAVTIEFIGGKFIFHIGNSLLINALTNSTYKKSIDFLERYRDFEFEKQIAHSTYRSLDRFVRITKRVEEFQSENIKPAIEYAFDILESVSVGKVKGQYTGWSIVYDIQNMILYFKTYENRSIRIVNINKFDFSNPTSSKVLNIADNLHGNVTDYFTTYSTEINRKSVMSVLDVFVKAGFIGEVSDTEIELLVNFPDRFKRK